MYGVMTDQSGLYYMRARYYNVDIKRFINQDVLTGSILNSQSLNRYSYVQGNPVSLTDPFGLSPDISWKGVGHALLDVLGFIPIVGDAFDIVNAVWYASEGNTLEAFSCVVSALPAIGSFVGNGIKWGAKGAKTATKVADGIKLTTRIASNTATLARGGYGAYVSGRQIYTDIKDGKGASFGDALKLGLNVVTVGLAGKSLKSNISLGRNYIKQAKQVEAGSNKTKGGSQADFYVTPNGDVVPATGYRYMDSKYATQTMSSQSALGSYFGFEKLDSASAVQDAYQVAPQWSNCKMRGEFDTLQVIDDIYVPKTYQNTGIEFEPFTKCYPEYGIGGTYQLKVDKIIKFNNVQIIGD